MTLPVFPVVPGLGWSVNRTTEWSTPKADSLSGKSIRYANWTFPKRHFTLTINVMRTAAAFIEWQTFEGFFNLVQGAFGPFAYDDPNDDTAVNQGFGQGDGVTTAFQLTRALAVGVSAEPVFLVNTLSAINVAGTPTSAYSISAYGLVTFNTPPALGAALTWSGTYWWACQFDEDTMDFENFMYQLMRTKSVKFSTVKLP